MNKKEILKKLDYLKSKCGISISGVFKYIELNYDDYSYYKKDKQTSSKDKYVTKKLNSFFKNFELKDYFEEVKKGYFYYKKVVSSLNDFINKKNMKYTDFNQKPANVYTIRFFKIISVKRLIDIITDISNKYEDKFNYSIKKLERFEKFLNLFDIKQHFASRRQVIAYAITQLRRVDF